MKCLDWDKVTLSRQYRRPNKPVCVKDKPSRAFDCETDRDGNPYLIHASDGRYLFDRQGLKLAAIIEFLTHSGYQGTLNTFYNLQFDAAAILKALPPKSIKRLWRFNECHFGVFTIEYIPKKYLAFKKDKKTWAFFDICQFFNMSLERASSIFLHDHKIKITIEDYDKLSDAELIDYCYQDAKLTERLTAYFIAMLDKLDCRVNKLYSTAYIAQKYFIKHCDIPRLYFKSKWADYAFKSYAGGRFEVFERGHHDKTYLYDINSAYPKYISGLADLRYGIWDYSTEYIDSAYYAFVKCRYRNEKDHTPIPFKEYALRIFPKGDYGEIYLSKSEYEFLERNGYAVEFIDGYFWQPDALIYPFEKCVNTLYAQRQQLKKEGNPLEHAIKIILNSLYGKFIQLTPHNEITTNDAESETLDVSDDGIEMYKTIFETGNLFNPVYAALITAGTRMQLFNAQHGNGVLAYATDSILSDTPLNLECDNALGNWKLEDIGESIIIGSGVYIMNGEKKHIEKFRGFGNSDKYHLEDLLKKNLNNKTVSISIDKPVTMGEAITHNKHLSISDISRFRTVVKNLNINFDVKRSWDRNFNNCRDVLTNNIQSEIIDLDEINRERALIDNARYRPDTTLYLHDDYTDHSLSRHEQRIEARRAWQQFK